MNITEIIQSLEDVFVETINFQENLVANNIETDSRKVTENTLFICIKGFESDGHKYSNQAVTNGANLLVVEDFQEVDVAQIKVSDSRKACALIAKLFYKNPTSKFTLIGITGTNGKTTTTKIVYDLLTKAGINAGFIGTLGYGFDGKITSLERTTPDILELNKIFFKMVLSNVKVVVMEVSSHAIALNRIYGLNFDFVCFSNLTRDHLDFHNSIEDYFETKKQLFTKFSYQKAFINTDDNYGKNIYDSLIEKKVGFGFGETDVVISNVNFNLDEVYFNIGKKKIYAPLIGRFNVYNLTLVYLILKEFLAENEILELMKNVKSVDGRLQRISNNKNIGVFVDHAHTPDALENVLFTLKEVSEGRIICVFGAGGNRDRGKRPKMLQSAQKYSDLIIITTDNPRFEEPENIIKDIVSDSNDNKLWIERDRKKAIYLALRVAKPGDIVLIAGKGQENYQEINGEKLHFDDREVAKEFFLNSEYKQRKLDENSSTIQLDFDIDVMNIFYLYSSLDKFLSPYDVIRFISTDSRTIKPKSLFFALKGELFDGHQYIEKVIEDKSVFVIASKNYKKNGQRILKVDDTLDAYQMLASRIRNLFGTKIIGITGSSGKTTTKEFLYNVLKNNFLVKCTYKNENNQIGCAKTIYKLSPETEIGIVEMGTNHFGEIKNIADFVNPDIGIITNIGDSHLEFLLDKNGVYKEKSELFNRNLDLKLTSSEDFFQEDISVLKVNFNPNSDYYINILFIEKDSIHFEINEERFTIFSPVKHNVINASLAIIVAEHLGISTKEIRKALDKKINIDNRMEIIKIKSHEIIFDCYNANPDSMKNAIEFWLEYQPERVHIAILGDMLELGVKSQEFHKEIGEKLKKAENASIYTIGNESVFYNGKQHFDNVEIFMKENQEKLLKENAIVLVKASHGIHLEKLKGWF